jgi:hypothetical protein
VPIICRESAAFSHYDAANIPRKSETIQTAFKRRCIMENFSLGGGRTNFVLMHFHQS